MLCTSRSESKSKIYHIMSRSLNKQVLFDTEQDYLYFLKILQEVKETDKFSSIHSYRNKKGNYLDLVDNNTVLKHCNSINFAKWNEEINYDRCLDIVNNKMTDEEVTRLLYKIINVNRKKEYLHKSEAEKVFAVLKLIDLSIPLLQLSRVTGFYYNKLQSMRVGKIGNVTKLTYKP